MYVKRIDIKHISLKSLSEGRQYSDLPTTTEWAMRTSVLKSDLK